MIPAQHKSFWPRPLGAFFIQRRVVGANSLHQPAELGPRKAALANNRHVRAIASRALRTKNTGRQGKH
jgi:hypothetical protein